MKKILFIIIALLFSYNSFSQCTITSLPYSENFNSIAYKALPPCWVKTYYSSGAQPYSGDRYLFFSNSKIFITKISPSIPINTLKLKMDIMGSSKVFVGVMDTNVDLGAYDTIGSLYPLSYSTFNTVEFNFSQYKGSGNYITLLSNGPVYIDNLVIQTTPPCSTPFNLTGKVNSNNVELSWAEGNVVDNAWWVYYKVDTASTKDSIYTNVKPFTVTGLQPMTNYDFWVVTDCGTNNSLSTNTFTVRTHCNTIDTLPYYDDFSTYGTGSKVFPPCWSRSNPTSSFLYVFNGKMVFYFNDNCAVTPQFSSDFNVKNFTMSMNIIHKSDGYALNGAKMYIGVMDSETDFSSFDTVAILNLPVDVYKNVKVNFNHYTGNGRYIAFRASHHNFTNLNIDYTPLCAPPYNIKSSTNSNITNITWLPGNDFTYSWWVYYKPNSSTNFDSVLVNSTSCILSNLLPNTNYTAYIKTTCNNNISTISSDTIAFKTYCLPIDNLPYVDNFNNFSSGSFPTCWYNYNSDGITNTVYTASGALYFFYSTNVTRMAITPYFSDNISLNTSMLKFRYMAGEYVDDTVMRPLIIGSMKDVEDINSFDSITTVYANYNWKNIDLNLAKYNFTGNYIVFKHSNGYFEVGIKNVIIDNIPSCPRPIDPKVDSITKISANISWDLFTGGESMWKIYYKPDYNQTYDSLITNTNVNTLLNLLPSSNYQAFVVTLCDTLKSQHSDTLYFKTDCATIDTLPFIENFSRMGINAYPNCWVNYNVEKYSNGIMYLRENGYFVTPEIDYSINVSDLIIRFKAGFYSNTPYKENNPLSIGVMSNPNDINSFDTIAVLKLNYNFSEYDISLENYNGNGRYIAFKKNYFPSNIMVDDLIIDNRSSHCVRPDSLLAIQNANNILNADLSWKDKDTSSLGHWVYSKLKGSSIIDSFYTTNNYITLQNLIPDTIYNFYLKTYCSIENDYLNTAPIEYYTPCLSSPISVFPYFEDFSSGINCWILKKNGELRESRWSSVNGYVEYYNYKYSSTHSLLDPLLVSPAFNYTTNMDLVFNIYKNNYSFNGVKLKVYLNSVPDTLGGVLLGEVSPYTNSTTNYWDTIKFSLPLNSLGLKYVIFQGYYYGEIRIDDIQIKNSPTCPENYSLKINSYDEKSVNLSWENSIIVPHNWVIAYEAINPQNFNPDSVSATKIYISDTSATQIGINGLKQGTEYSIALRPLCDSIWSNTLNVRTLNNAQLPYFTDFNDSLDNYNWVISNGNTVNGWYISPSVNDSLITGKSLMISNNNGANNAYTINQVSCVTTSRQFESTGANEYTLKFDLRIRGESGYDYLKVFVVNKDTNYLGGNTQMYYANKTFNNNAVLYGGHNNTCPTCSYYTKGDSIMTSINIKLNNQGAAGNIKKLVFVWYNDHSLGFNPPPAIDNISLTNYVKEIHISDTICKGTHYNFYGQNIDSTGTYTHQFQTSNILDSIIYLNLLVKPSYHDTIYADICQGEIYNQFGFNDSITGFYTQNLQTTLGCDSIVNLNLNVHSVLTPSNLILDNISNYIELTWNGDEENYIIYKDSDSLAITNLKVYRDTNVVVGENYCYKIKALTGDCYSDYSSEECMIFSSIGSVNTYNLNVTLYPNPTENKTILRFDGEKENADIHIYDINGKLVKTLKLKAEDDELEINVQGFEKGVYNIRITNSKINIIKKLIII